MTLTENEIEYRLRRAIERQLKHNGGHCQITIRRLGKEVYQRKGNHKFVNPSDSDGNKRNQKQQIYAMAAKLCEEYGGVWNGDVGWSRSIGENANSPRVYQF